MRWILPLALSLGCSSPPGMGDPDDTRRLVDLVAGQDETCALLQLVAPPADDAAVPDPDLGAPDLGPPIDFGARDGGSLDAGPPDLGPPDPPDLGAPDLGAPDAGPAPAGSLVLRCWGDGVASPRRPDDAPARIAGASTQDTRCVVRADGEVRCWGPNEEGQTGQPPSDTEPPSTVRLDAPATRVQLGVGGEHACALTLEGLECWGAGDEGQLGDGRASQSSRPVRVELEGVTDFALGAQHTCAVAEESLWCWGADDRSQSGGVQSDVPRRISTDRPVTRVVAGRAHTCVLDTVGTVDCFGDDSFGQLGRGSAGTESDRPREVDLPDPVTVLAAGTDHTCAAGPTRVFCWGAGDDGQTGATAPLPGRIERLSIEANMLALGESHSCASVVGAEPYEVRCWGSDAAEQLGGASVERSESPIRVGGLR